MTQDQGKIAGGEVMLLLGAVGWIIFFCCTRESIVNGQKLLNK